jgi:cytosine/adenosine deaminase-related metal-dependent hydrolase
MRLIPLLGAAALALFSLACSTHNEVSNLKVLIGATAVFQPGGSPVQDTVIVIEGDTIRAAGERKDVPVPQNSERADLTGKWVVPVSGGKIAPGAPADLFVLNTGENGSPAAGAPARHMIHGHWQ